MIKTIKVQKNNQVKEIEAQLLPTYLTNGWSEYKNAKVVENQKEIGKIK
jgi:hypothetical protein